MASKQLGKLKQWAGEVISSKDKITMSEELLTLEKDVELRRIGLERLFHASEDYYKVLLKKKGSDEGDGKMLHIESLGLVMISHGNDFGNDSSFGQSLVKFGRAHCKIAALQETYAEHFQGSYIASLQSAIEDVKDYQLQRKKLDSRRLAYDAALTKSQKSFKKEKDKNEAEEEVKVTRARLEEASEEVETRLHAIRENEVQQLSDVTAFLNLELKFADSYLKTLKALKDDWIDEASFRHMAESKQHVPSHTFPRSSTPNYSRATTPSKKSKSLPTTDSSSDSERPAKENHTERRRKRSDSVVTSGSANTSGTGVSRRMSGWASSAVNSVKGKKKDTKQFSALDDDLNYEEPVRTVPGRDAPTGSGALSLSRSGSLSSPKVPPRKRKPESAGSKRMKVMFDFDATAADELSLRAGMEVIVITEVSDGWWVGECDGQQGLFPVTYTEEVKKPPVPPRPVQPPISHIHALSSEENLIFASPMPESGPILYVPPHKDQSSVDEPFGDHNASSNPLTLNPRSEHPREQTDDSDDDQNGDHVGTWSPHVSSASLNSGGAGRGLITTAFKKAPPPPPPSRRAQSSNNTVSTPIPTAKLKRTAARSLSTGSIQASWSLTSHKSPFEGDDNDEDREALQTRSCGECGCEDFKQNMFKAKGSCSVCFHTHA